MASIVGQYRQQFTVDQLLGMAKKPGDHATEALDEIIEEQDDDRSRLWKEIHTLGGPSPTSNRRMIELDDIRLWDDLAAATVLGKKKAIHNYRKYNAELEAELDKLKKDKQPDVLLTRVQRRTAIDRVRQHIRAKKTRKTPRALRRRKRHSRNFKLYIKRVLREVHPQLDISTTALNVMNDMVTDVMERFFAEAHTIILKERRSTVNATVMAFATRLLLSDGLKKYAHAKAIKSLTSYDTAGN